MIIRQASLTSPIGRVRRAGSVVLPACVGLVCLAAGTAPVQADVYMYRDANGVAHLTNVPPGHDSRYRLFQKSAMTAPKGWHDGYSVLPELDLHSYQETINHYAHAYGVDPALVRAVVHAESAFRPDVVSSKGAGGLMQLMPGTAKQYGVQDRFNPKDNIAGGVAYLAFLLDLFNNNERLAVAAYNAGENAVKKYGGVPPYNETRRYVKRVMSLHKRYAARLARQAASVGR